MLFLEGGGALFGTCDIQTWHEKVKHYPTPTDVTSIRQFLGSASYYRHFVPNFARIASPLHSLTCKNTNFVWTEACEAAFCELKRALVSGPILAYPCLGMVEVLYWKLMPAM